MRSVLNLWESLFRDLCYGVHKGERVIRVVTLARLLVVSCALLVLPAASAQSPYQFNAGVLLPSGTSQPALISQGDFNNDGKLDVVSIAACLGVTSCSTPYVVAVYLGKGDGTFQSGIVTLVPSPARSLVVGDFNGDGKLDVLVASDDQGSSGTLTVLLGNGDGTFTQSASYPVNGINNSLDVSTLAVGDFNGDGKLDLVATLACYNIPINSCNVGAVMVFPGNGDGTLDTPQIYQTIGNGALPVVVTDLNGDGRPDIVTGNPYAPGDTGHSSLTVLLNTGSGAFSESIIPLSYFGIGNIVSADFNGDGKMDLATTYAGTQLLFGNGDGTFQAPVQYSTGSYELGIAVADFNGDGKPDLVVGGDASGFQNEAAILINDGTGNFQVSEYPLGGWGQGNVISGDFNGDGKADVLLNSNIAETSSHASLDGTLGLLLGNGDGTMQAATILPAPTGVSQPNVMLTADLNGDGIPDLIQVGWGSAGPSLVTVFLGMGGGAFAPPTTITTGAYEANAAIVGDFNHDGKIDVAVSHDCLDDLCTTGGVAILLGKGDGTFQEPITYSTPASAGSTWIAGGDVNGDGNIDLIVTAMCSDSNCPHGSISILRGVGDGTFQNAVTTDTPDQYDVGVVAADLNHDGKAEIVAFGRATVANSTGDQPATELVFSVNADGSLSQIGETYSVGGYLDQFSSSVAGSLAIGDINNDGNPDIVVTTECANAYCNDAPPPNDLSGEGGGGVGVLLGNGDGTFTPGHTYDIPDANFGSAALADVTGDGKLDLIATTYSGMALFPGNGDGTFGLATVYAGAAQDVPLQIAVADLNGDGSLDVAVPNSVEGTTALFFNRIGLPGSASAPTDLTAKAVSPAEIDLAWKESSGNVTQFDIEDSSDGIDFSSLAAVGKGVTSYAVTGLNPGTQWAFRVRAENAEGYTLYSNIATATTPLLYTTSTTLTASPDPAAVGQNVILTATVTGGNAPTGSVSFMDGATQLGGAPLVGNQATFTASFSVSGAHNLSATYGGDGYNAGSTGPLTLMVTGTGTSCTTGNPNPNPNPVVFGVPADFNGDCRSDILWRNSSSGQAYTWFMNGTSQTSAASPGTAASPWVIQGTGDFNGDGKADILWRNTTTGQVYIWLMNGTTLVTAASPGTVANAWAIMGVGDFDGDGKSDILWQNTTTGQIYVWLMNGTTLASSGTPGTVGAPWAIKGVGDFNGDGKADILWQSTTTGQVYVWLMNGTALTTSNTPGSAAAPWTIKGVGDFNGDGKSDILWQNTSTGQVYLWLMNGTALVSAASPGTVGSPWTIKEVGDYNGDGKADILWQSSSSGQVYVWLMNGATLSTSGTPGSAAAPWQIVGP